MNARKIPHASIIGRISVATVVWAVAFAVTPEVLAHLYDGFIPALFRSPIWMILASVPTIAAVIAWVTITRTQDGVIT